ncbi:MAG: hypothetical protein GC168_10115 [Candidatus Hydrogenedens sp.]|nr:hypothetical protein [Candidatus Hydrogenedens sp.]
MPVSKPNTKVDAFFELGCGRCPLGPTPECKTKQWLPELKALRALLLESELVETVKWGSPCYTLDNRNVVMLGAFRDYCVISFLKGVLLKDTKRILVAPGENSQSARVVRFTSAKDVAALAPVLRAYVAEAAALERSGAKVAFKAPDEHDVPAELQARLAKDPELKAAFEALTPGRQRGYLIHIAGAKQAATRESRIDKCRPMILAGKGMHDR